MQFVLIRHISSFISHFSAQLGEIQPDETIFCLLLRVTESTAQTECMFLFIRFWLVVGGTERISEIVWYRILLSPFKRHRRPGSSGVVETGTFRVPVESRFRS